MTSRIVLLPPPGALIHDVTSPQHIEPQPSRLFHAACHIRTAVFVKEQGCPADEEVDAEDSLSWHFILYSQLESPAAGSATEDVPAATMRFVPPQTHHLHSGPHSDADRATDGITTEPKYESSSVWDGQEPYAKIGRLATLKPFRGNGYGAKLVQAGLEWARTHTQEISAASQTGEWKGLVLAHAQKDVERWYARLGWERDEGMGMWDEVGIAHVAMWKRV